MSKQEIRQRLLMLRRQLEYQEALSKKITEHIIKSDIFLQAETVLLYRSVNSEVNTDFLWDACKKLEKRCYFPKCISKTEMIAVSAEKREDFVLSDKNIPEPIGEVAFPKEKLDLIVVPGVGFDRKKNRLGYGGGFYDRYLADYSGVTIGICYDALLCDDVLAQAWDIPLDWIVTENGIF